MKKREEDEKTMESCERKAKMQAASLMIKAGLMVVLCTVMVWSLLRNFGYNISIICNHNNHSAFFNTDTHLIHLALSEYW